MDPQQDRKRKDRTNKVSEELEEKKRKRRERKRQKDGVVGAALRSRSLFKWLT
jgi:hypothetical protein